MNVIHRQMQQNIYTYKRTLNFKNLQKEDSPKMTVCTFLKMYKDVGYREFFDDLRNSNLNCMPQKSIYKR